MIYHISHLYQYPYAAGDIWNLLTSIGTIAAAFLAYKALNQSNRQLQGEQRPYIVAGNISYNGNDIQFKNVGKGTAFNLYVSSDPKGNVHIQHPSLPEFQFIEPGKELTTLMVDENRIISYYGLNKQLKHLNELKEEFHLYFWYKDVSGKHYRTQSTFKKSGLNLKSIDNQFTEID